tara:strand:- start:208 stop:585 length:378 start_codon:yes stop_codon:yes gene_type:complete
MPPHPVVRTPENRAIVLEALKEVGSYITAAGAAGIGRETLLQWRKADAAFGAECERARASHFRRAVVDILADETLKASDRIKLLGMIHPEATTAPAKVEIGTTGGAAATLVVYIPDDGSGAPDDG